MKYKKYKLPDDFKDWVPLKPIKLNSINEIYIPFKQKRKNGKKKYRTKIC